MEFIHTSGPYGDETSKYDVRLKKEYTVKEFVEKVLLNKDEWGYIGIYKRCEIFGKPNCEYWKGKLTTNPLPEEYLDKKIRECKASGGWTRMDYILYLEENENE